MECERIVFSGRAIRRMFERAIGSADVLEVIGSGKVVAEYPDDEPFPSFLMLGYVGGRPLHVVVAMEGEGRTCHVVTAYDPDPALWGEDFKTRRSS